MNVLHMTAQVATLSETLIAHGTAEGTISCVLPKVVSEIAALSKD